MWPAQSLCDISFHQTSPSHAQQLRDVLHKRLNMKNPHKVWLATHLAEAILEKCSDVVGPIRSDIYQVLFSPLDLHLPPVLCVFLPTSLHTPPFLTPTSVHAA